jgi:hypothetical protein
MEVDGAGAQAALAPIPDAPTREVVAVTLPFSLERLDM